MNKEDMIKIGTAVFVVIILIVVVVIVTRKKDNYQYPTGQMYNQPSGAPGAIQRGNGGPSITTSTSVALVADTNGNINTTAAVPIGAIIMWGGSVTSIPLGWGLCNGTVYGNITSPDLTGRFVVGAGQSPMAPAFTTQYGVGDMGGEEFHQLTIEEMPSHNHGIVKNPSNEQYSGWNFKAWGVLGSDANPPGVIEGGDPNNTVKDANGMAIPLTLPHNNMPPYYALAYIIKYM